MPNRIAAARRLGRWALGALFIGFAATLSGQATTAAEPAGGVETDAPVDAGGGVALPRVLSAKDAALYARIFELQEAGDWHTSGSADDHEPSLRNATSGRA